MTNTSLLHNKTQILLQKLSQRLMNQKDCVTTAESCTAGLIASTLVSQPGASSYFDRAFVTYSNAAKVEMLNISELTLERYGAVSPETVKEMAENALRKSHATLSIAVSGIAGPSGGTEKKPVGTVCIAWASTSSKTQTHTFLFKGNRDTIRLETVYHALTGLLDYCATN